MTLGQRICMYRTRQQLSQAVLAEQLEVSRQSVSKWETDASVPELDKLIRMSELFDVSLEELIKGQPAKLSSNEPRKEVVSEKISEQIVSPETTEITEHEEAVSETEPTQKHTQSHAASAEKEPLSWQKIVAIFFLVCGVLSTILSFLLGIWPIFLPLIIASLIVAPLIYLSARSHPLLKAGWALWVLLYIWLRLHTGIRFWWIFNNWGYQSDLTIHSLIAWTEFLTLALLIGYTVKCYRK